MFFKVLNALTDFQFHIIIAALAVQDLTVQYNYTG